MFASASANVCHQAPWFAWLVGIAFHIVPLADSLKTVSTVNATGHLQLSLDVDGMVLKTDRSWHFDQCE